MDPGSLNVPLSCVVRLQKHRPSRTSSFHPQDDKQMYMEFSCSGIVIDPPNGLVLTTGQVFSEAVKSTMTRNPVLTSTKKWKISTRKWTASTKVYTATDLMQDVCVDVIVPQQSSQSSLGHPPIASFKSNHGHLSRGFSSNLGTVTVDAELVLLWKCQEFDNVLKTVVPERDGWKYSEDKENSGESETLDSERDFSHGHCVEPHGLSSVSSNLPDENFISWFALLKLRSDRDGFSGLRYMYPRPSIIPDTLHAHQGDLVTLHTTPFGATCPSVFLNSISRGIISNVAGSRHALIMTDARCIPGSEGGGLYVMKPRDRSFLAGIIVSPLCWKNNEWIGLTLACSIPAVLESLQPITDSTWATRLVTRAPDPHGSNESRQGLTQSSIVQQCMRSVVLIKVGAVWGSGVIVNAEHGIILTCRHVVHKATDRYVRVRLDWPHTIWEDATIVYTTSESSPLDLAIVKLQGDLNALRTAVSAAGNRTAPSYKEGQPVITVGHALLAPELNLQPSVSIGVVSKVTEVNSAPVMLQSTCAVHAGASGGALFCPETGDLLGIVTSNARDVDSGASFPHVNFSIPWAFIKPILHEYLQMDDITKLHQKLDADNDYISAIWSLDEKHISGKRLPSKL